MMRNQLMIDLETTGTKAGCRVLSLGAFGFTAHSQQTEFYRRFALPVQSEVGLTDDLTDDASTMEWWSKQSADVRDEAFSGNTDPADGIAEFKRWFYENFDTGYGSNFQVWSCGIDFDFPILGEFFRRFGFQLPWKFWTQYDYRTVKNLFDLKRLEGNPAAHNALEDAKAQMRGLRSFWGRYIDNV